MGESKLKRLLSFLVILQQNKNELDFAQASYLKKKQQNNEYTLRFCY